MALRCFERQSTMLRRIYFAERNRSVRHHRRRIKRPKFHAREKEPAKRNIDIASLDEPLFHCIASAFRFLPQFGIGAVKQRIGCCRMRCVERGVVTVRVPEIGHGAAVRGRISLKVPVATQHGLHQQIGAAGWLTVNGVVGAHHRAGLGI